MVRLGWAHGDKEFFCTEELKKIFTLKAIGKSPSRFDFTKLENMNGHYIRNADNEYLVQQIKTILPEIENGEWFQTRWSDEREKQLIASMPGLKERAKTLIELIEGARYLFVERPLPMEDKAAAILDKNDGAGRAILKQLIPHLSGLSYWNLESIEEEVRKFTDAQELKLGQVAQPIRAALTGKTTSPGVFDVMAVLNKQDCISRLEDQVS